VLYHSLGLDKDDTKLYEFGDAPRIIRRRQVAGKRHLHFLCLNLVGTIAIGGRRLAINKIKLVDKWRVNTQPKHREDIRQSAKHEKANGQANNKGQVVETSPVGPFWVCVGIDSRRQAS
jgi:hypothetical protein